MLSYLRHPSRLRKKRGKMLKHAQGLEIEGKGEVDSGEDSHYVDNENDNDYSQPQASDKSDVGGSHSDEESSIEYRNGEPVPKQGRYLAVDMEELPRLTEDRFNGRLVLAYQFSDDMTLLNWLKLLPKNEGPNTDFGPDINQTKTKKIDKFKNGWTKARTKIQPGKMNRQHMRQLALDMNQNCQVFKMIEKSRSQPQTNNLEKSGIVKYSQDNLEQLGNGSQMLGPRQLVFMIGIDILFVRVPGWLTENWIDEYTQKVGPKSRGQVSLYLYRTLELLERLEKFIYYYRLDLDQLQEIGHVYNGLVNLDMVSDLMELYYDFVKSSGELQKIQNKIPKKDWIKLSLSDTFLNYGLDIHWSVIHDQLIFNLIE